MKQIVECVPNFSEGRDQQTIDALMKLDLAAGVDVEIKL